MIDELHREIDGLNAELSAIKVDLAAAESRTGSPHTSPILTATNPAGEEIADRSARSASRSVEKAAVVEGRSEELEGLKEELIQAYTKIRRTEERVLLLHQQLEEAKKELEQTRSLSPRAQSTPTPSLLMEYGTEYRMRRLREAFHQFDLDDSGKISSEEFYKLGQARRDLGQSEGTWSHGENNRFVIKIKRALEGFNELDLDHPATYVTREEFVAYHHRHMPQPKHGFDLAVQQYLDVAEYLEPSEQSQSAPPSTGSPKRALLFDDPLGAFAKDPASNAEEEEADESDQNRILAREILVGFSSCVAAGILATSREALSDREPSTPRRDGGLTVEEIVAGLPLGLRGSFGKWIEGKHERALRKAFREQGGVDGSVLRDDDALMMMMGGPLTLPLLAADIQDYLDKRPHASDDLAQLVLALIESVEESKVQPKKLSSKSRGDLSTSLAEAVTRVVHARKEATDTSAPTLDQMQSGLSDTPAAAFGKWLVEDKAVRMGLYDDSSRHRNLDLRKAALDFLKQCGTLTNLRIAEWIESTNPPGDSGHVVETALSPSEMKNSPSHMRLQLQAAREESDLELIALQHSHKEEIAILTAKLPSSVGSRDDAHAKYLSQRLEELNREVLEARRWRQQTEEHMLGKEAEIATLKLQVVHAAGVAAPAVEVPTGPQVTRERLWRFFNAMDRNGDGHIARAEMIQALRKDPEVRACEN